MVKANNDRAQLINLKNRFSNVLGGRFRSLIRGGITILSWHTLVFLRRDFGENVFGLLWIAYGWLCVKIYVLLLKVFVFFSTMEITDMVLGGKSVPVDKICSSSLLDIHVKLFIVASLIHFMMLKKRNKEEKRWYSMCLGKSFLMNLPYVKRLKLNEIFVWMYIEPAIIFFLGFVLYTFWIDWVYGLFLMLSGFSLFYREQHNYNEHREKITSMWDGEIMATQFLAAFKGKKIDNTQGYTIYGAASSEILDSFGIVLNEVGKGITGTDIITKKNEEHNGNPVKLNPIAPNENYIPFKLNPSNIQIDLLIKEQLHVNKKASIETVK